MRRTPSVRLLRSGASPRAVHRRAPAALLLLAALACGDAGAESGAAATPDDVDTSSEGVVTERELAAFSPPRDGVLTEAHVTQYLQTSLLQFDLVRQESAALHDRLKQMEGRAESGGVLSGLRNLADAGRLFADASDLLGGSYVRSARTLGHNPAEMEWVRERMMEAATYVSQLQMQAFSRSAVEQLREQARDLERRRTAGEEVGLSADDIRQMLTNAEEMEREIAASEDESARRTYEVLRRAKPAVTHMMWMQLGWNGAGFAGWAGLADPNDAAAQQQLDEYRKVFEDALANRVTPGLEDPTPTP